MKQLLTIVLIFLAIGQSVAQIVHIPDANFKNLLLNDHSINTNFDDEIQVSEAEAADEIYMDYEGVADLTGLEAFVNLEILRIYGNVMPSIDLTTLTALTNLVLANTPVSILDLSNNTALLTLEMGGNQITDLDLSNNLDLLDIYIVNEPLTNLNLGNNTSLEYLVAGVSGSIPTVDVSNNTGLKKIELVNNGMTSLNVENNLNLEILRSYGNNLTELDVSNNLMLKELNTMYNQLTTLDLSSNTNLEWFNARNNTLETVDARNGNNEAFTNFNVLNNPNLECILVDDPTASYLFSWLVDDGMEFGTDYQNCQPLLSIDQPEPLVANIYPNPVQDILHLNMSSNIELVRIYNILGQLVDQEPIDIPTPQYQLDLSNLFSGIYYIEVQTDRGEATMKIVKM